MPDVVLRYLIGPLQIYISCIKPQMMEAPIHIRVQMSTLKPASS